MKGNRFIRFGELMDKADSFDPLPHDSETVPGSPDIYQKVWTEASKMRRSGKLLNLGKMIRCPVVAIHGDYDPHPAVGVQEPLSRVLQDFRFILLEKCATIPGSNARQNSNSTMCWEKKSSGWMINVDKPIIPVKKLVHALRSKLSSIDNPSPGLARNAPVSLSSLLRVAMLFLR